MNSEDNPRSGELVATGSGCAAYTRPVRDAITIRISHRARRTILLVLLAFIVIGFIVPLILVNAGRSTGVHDTPPVSQK